MRELTESYWPLDASRPLLNITVGELLQQAAADAPETTALISVAPGRGPRTWTYAELRHDAEHAASWLLERFSPGEHVAVWAPNVPEWIVLQYGAALAGLVLVTTSPALRTAELSYALDKSHAAGVFHVGDLRGTDMASVVQEVLPKVPGVREAVRLEGWLDDVRRVPRCTELPEVDPQSPTQIQFTSGTTGSPKAAILKHMAMVTNAALVRERCGASIDATFATALPLFHTAGCGLSGMGSIHGRATLVLAEVFDPTTLLNAMQDHRAVILGAVPAMLHGLLAHPQIESFDLNSLEVVMSGGDLVPPLLVDAWAKLCGARASAVYGQTELSPIVCQTRPNDERADNLFTAGQPLPQVEVRILDPESGETQPTGVAGEICARGYQCMAGYLDMPEETAKTIDVEGWLHTGDLGSMDSRGFVTITGRLKDMIIRGGENIYPREIEDVLLTHPAVTNAVVLGLEDEAWGETVAAVVQLSADDAPSGRELHDFVRQHLAPHKTPKSWYATQDLPLNSMGKLQKFRLRDRIRTGEMEEL